MILHLNGNVNEVDLSDFKQYTTFHSAAQQFFPMKPGENHHNLLACLSSQLPAGSLVADLGTHLGHSALALASNPNVNVLTIDIRDFAPPMHSFKEVQNIKFICGNCIDLLDEYINALIILLDIDPHDGKQEQVITDLLSRRGFKGILVCDDIHLSDSMRYFWNSIPYRKIDATVYGHYSGTGIVVFDPYTIDVSMV